MGFPDENMKGYKEASVLEDISNLRNKKYLIIHGNADDNVHYQNAMMLVRVLEKQNIPFELMVSEYFRCKLGWPSRYCYIPEIQNFIDNELRKLYTKLQ